MIVVPISSLLPKFCSLFSLYYLKHFSALFLFYKIVCIPQNNSILRIYNFCLYIGTKTYINLTLKPFRPESGMDRILVEEGYIRLDEIMLETFAEIYETTMY